LPVWKILLGGRSNPPKLARKSYGIDLLSGGKGEITRPTGIAANDGCGGKGRLP